MIDIGVQCYIEPTQHQEHRHELVMSSETESEDDAEENDDDIYIEKSEEEHSQETTVTPSKAAFIVYWSLLLVLLKHCLYPACIFTTIITEIAYKGSQLIVKMKCIECHETTWKSQPNCNHYSVGNFTSAASVLFSANTYKRLANFFDLASTQWLSKTSSYAIQKRYLMGVINKNYNEKSKEITADMQKHGVYHLSGRW